MTAENPEILFNDGELIVFNKPAGLLSIRDPRHPRERTVLDAAGELLKGAKVFPVHRLDKETSGILKDGHHLLHHGHEGVGVRVHQAPHREARRESPRDRRGRDQSPLPRARRRPGRSDSAAGKDLKKLLAGGPTRELIFPLMVKGAAAIIQRLVSENKAHGVISCSGTRGITLSALVMQELPVRFPKLLVSTIAS